METSPSCRLAREIAGLGNLVRARFILGAALAQPRPTSDWRAETPLAQASAARVSCTRRCHQGCAILSNPEQMPSVAAAAVAAVAADSPAAPVLPPVGRLAASRATFGPRASFARR